MSLLPLATRCAQLLDNKVSKEHLGDSPAGPLKQGRWVIRATPSLSSAAVSAVAAGVSADDCEEYVVDFCRVGPSVSGFHGSGIGTTGRSANGHVNIVGTARGTDLRFVEEWADGLIDSPVTSSSGRVGGKSTELDTPASVSSMVPSSSSSCVIEARLSLDGMRFDGLYRNVQYGTSGHIAGMYCPEAVDPSGTLSTPESIGTSSDEEAAFKERGLIQSASLLSLAVSRLSVTLLSEAVFTDIMHQKSDNNLEFENKRSLKPKREEELLNILWSSPLLAGGMVDPTGTRTNQAFTSIKKLFSPRLSSNSVCQSLQSRWQETVFPVLQQPVDAESLLSNRIVGDELDALLASKTGGQGSLSPLDPRRYQSTRRLIIKALLYHTSLYDSTISAYQRGEFKEGSSCEADAKVVWQTALRIMESGIRASLSRLKEGAASHRDSCRTFCTMATHLSEFLFLLHPAASFSSRPSIAKILSEAEDFYSNLSSPEELLHLEEQMNAMTKWGVIRHTGLSALKLLLQHEGSGIRTQAAMECAMLSLPRLLGRGGAAMGPSGFGSGKLRSGRHTSGELKDSKPANVDRGSTSDQVDIGGYYLTDLFGCSSEVQGCLRDTVHSLYVDLGKMLLNIVDGNDDSASSASLTLLPSSQSLVLSILANFFLTIRPADHDGIIVQSKIWDSLRVILSRCKVALVMPSESKNLPSDSSTQVTELLKSCGRHTSRSILRCANSVELAILTQLAMQLNLPSRSFSLDSNGVVAEKCVSAALGVLQSELFNILRFIGKSRIKQKDLESLQQVESDYEMWCDNRDNDEGNDLGTKSSSRKKQDANVPQGELVGFRYLLEHGTIAARGNRSLSSGSSSSGGTSEYIITPMVSPNHYLTHLLNILYSVVRSEPFVNCMTSESAEIVMLLLNAVGVKCHSQESGKITAEEVVKESRNEDYPLPIRHRVRMLRLLWHLLPSVDPDQSIIESLFRLAGLGMGISETKSKTNDDDAHTISKEVVSLLRYLHACSLSASPDSKVASWKLTIHSVMQMDEETDIITKRGLLAFLGGIPGRIAQGAYVLLKPSAAASLSAPSSSSSSSKSHGGSSGGGSSSSSSTSPVVAGSGMEGIVSGLCRRDAMAGMVSSVDVTGGTCEVILFNRMDLPFHHGVDAPTALGAGKHSTGMSVRAVRAHLSDVVSAEEVPLLLYESLPLHGAFGTCLSGAVDELLPLMDSLENAEGENDGESKRKDKGLTSGDKEARVLADCVVALRSSIVVLCDQGLLKEYLQGTKSSKEFLSKLLQFAASNSSSKGNATTESLSALPGYEARYWHLRGMLLNAATRRALLDSTPREQWEAFTRKGTEDAKAEEKKVESLESKGEGYLTPPSAVGALSSSSGALSSGDGDSSESLGRSQSRRHELSGMNASSSRTANEEEEDNDEDDEAARTAEETAAAHLREAAIVQMAELGLPRSWAELALRRTGGANIEAAVHFCLERGGDMERLVAEDRERERRMMAPSPPSGSGRSRRNLSGSGSGGANHLIRQLIEMGFPSHWCAEALAATGNNVDEALTWILTNGERLRDLGNDEDELDDDDDDEEEEEEEEEEEDSVEEDEAAQDDNVRVNEEVSGEDVAEASGAALAADVATVEESEQPDGGEAAESTDAAKSEAEKSATSKKENEEKSSELQTKAGWPKETTCPLRSVSGRSTINPRTLEISGLPTGGFSSVGTKGIPLVSGKWYYEAILLTAGCLQIGWADSSFAGHCQAERGDGCGDGPSSWAYDGWRRYRWHSSATEWGCRWEVGDVVGCLVDMDNMVISFTLNGRGEEVGMGEAFSGTGFRPCGGVYACVSFNRRERIRLILGGEGSEEFKYQPPPGYRGVGDAVLRAVKERDTLMKEEEILCRTNDDSSTLDVVPKRYLCDFSGGEHGHELFAWQHRYYGADASVHLGGSRSGSRSGIRGGSHRSSSGVSSSSSSSGDKAARSAASCVTARLLKAWKEGQDTSKSSGGSSKDKDTEKSSSDIIAAISMGYDAVIASVESELIDTIVALGLLYSRKLILHLILTLSEDFSLDYFIPSEASGENSEMNVAQSLWHIIETCCSLQSAGWVGEAGAMAVAAEALGLGISSHDHHQQGGGGTVLAASNSTNDQDSGLLLAAGGISQVLSTVFTGNVKSAELPVYTEPSLTLVACAEAAFGGDGGGSLVFLRGGLKSAVDSSSSFEQVLVAAVRRSVRLLAVVEYADDDAVTSASSSQGGNAEDEDMDTSTTDADEQDSSDDTSSGTAPDARLASFLTGLLLTRGQKSAGLINKDRTLHSVGNHLFEAWSVGLLSASAPWRMVCALTASGILNFYPDSLARVVSRVPTLKNLYSRLYSTVARRVWAERAAVPVCSRYVQAFIELLTSVRRSSRLLLPSDGEIPRPLSDITVDAATPRPLVINEFIEVKSNEPGNEVQRLWEWDEGWISSDGGWEVWTGTVEYMKVEWTAPSRSAVRTLMDGGEGPPMLREGCKVLRGLDWEEKGSGSVDVNEDGKDIYEKEKAAREKERQSSSEEKGEGGEAEGTSGKDTKKEKSDKSDASSGDGSPEEQSTPTSSKKESGSNTKESQSSKKKKKKKIPNPKLPIGTVLSVEPWKGLPGLGRRVRWNLTGKEGVYRYGGDGGRYDIAHVEVNEKATRVRKRYPLPESAEQCASRYGFGLAKRYNVLLRLRRHGKQIQMDDSEDEFEHEGVLEWPDFGAGVRVDCRFHSDGAVTVTEHDLLYGSKDSGWEARFGQPSYVPGTVMVISPTTGSSSSTLDELSSALSHHEELLGSSSFVVEKLRNRADGEKLRVTSEMRLLRGRTGTSNHDGSHPSPSLPTAPARIPPPIYFDRDYHAPSISLSCGGRTLTCVTSDGRCSAFGSVGFTKGTHYWEVKLEQADIGSVFIGVAEKPSSGSSGGSSSIGYESQPRLNRWHGWGFVNFRATYTAAAERVYGAHCHAGDTVGVLLDCDSGRISFFFDGVKYGEHILNDLGCAFENVSPFGFNADGCGSGGAGQGAPSGIESGRGGRYPANGAVRPRALWPVVGLRNPGDRVTMSGKWMTGLGVDGGTVLKNALSVDEILSQYDTLNNEMLFAKAPQLQKKRVDFPKWFIEESFSEYNRWLSGRWLRSSSRGSGPHPHASVGLDVDLDTSLMACACACASLGLRYVLLPGDRVSVKRSAGRMLELSEEAVVLGACQGRLFYRIVSQKSEGGSLTEGGGRAWFWDESEVVDGGLQLIGKGRSFGLDLPVLDRFKCVSPGGLKIVYVGGAVVRSDLEIFDGSANIGTIPHGTVIPRGDVLERRVNSCGVVRFRLKYEKVGEGWISSRIRGGKEEAIVEPLFSIPESDKNANSSSDKESDSSGCKEAKPLAQNFVTPEDSAKKWLQTYNQHLKELEEEGTDSGVDTTAIDRHCWEIRDTKEFEDALESGIIANLSIADSDRLLASVVSAIADFSPSGDAVDCQFEDIASALNFVVKSQGTRSNDQNLILPVGVPGANQAAASIFSSLSSKLPSVKALLARSAMLRALNRRARVALPWLSLRPAQEGSAILGGLCGFGASVERSGRSRDYTGMANWVQVPSVASRIRTFRELFFSSVKFALLESMMDATTTPTPLSHDEYELPREVRTVRVNRLRARRAMASDEAASKKKHSVFSQLQHEMRGWSGAALRRGHVAKGHGGQKRAFKVKLVGEGVNDYSGPYREVFTDAMREVTELNLGSHGALNVLEPSPNNISALGNNRDLFVFASDDAIGSTLSEAHDSLTQEEWVIRKSFSSFISERSESEREIEESLVFLGRLVGTACRHGILVDLPLPLKLIWNRLAESKVDEMETLREVDLLAYRQLEKMGKENLSTSIDLHSTLAVQQRMLNSFTEGISSVLPVELFSLFTGLELRDTICGNPDVDVDLLRRVVEYEDYKGGDDVIVNFWQVLREMTDRERKLFLQFVWARTRLPMKESDFEAPFKIQRDSKNTDDDDADTALPSASTCFFSLSLPEYSTKEILKEKLVFAIENVTTMESDYVTNDAEVGEGWRGL